MRDKWIKHKVIIISTILVATALTGAFFWGGLYPESADSLTPPVLEAKESDPAKQSDGVASLRPADLETAGTTTEEASSNSNKDAVSSDENASSLPEEAALGVTTGSTGKSESQSMEINPQAGQDQYKTNPVPAEKPVPVEPQNATVTDTSKTCTLSVSCKTVLNNMELLDQDKWELVPEDGVIFAATTVTFHEGESVFNLLQREMKKAGIQMEFENTPIYNSAYIESIDNLYEFDAGELSGWVYEVNGWFPNYGCSRYQLQDGDVVRWLYTCDLGQDVGGSNLAGS